MSPNKRKLATAEVGEKAPSSKARKKPEERRESGIHNKALVKGFSRLKSEGKVCDFVIVFEGEEIPVHRAVLAASSKYFEAMVAHDTAEKKKGRVEIQGVTLKAGKQCIEFMYTGGAFFSIESPEDLIYAAELMDLPALTDMYFGFLKENLTTKDCLKYLQLAETFNHTGRRSFVEFFKNFSARNFEDIVQCEELPNMSLSLLEQCLEAAPATGRQCETAKWCVMLTWVNADLKARENSFHKLFKTLRLGYLSDDFLRNTVLEESVVKRSMEVKDIVLNATLNPTKSKPDTAAFDRGVSYIIFCRSESRMLFKFDVRTGLTCRFARIPLDVFQKPNNIVSVNGEVYLTSGDAIGKFRDGSLVNLMNTGFESEYHQCIAHRGVIYIVSKERICKYNTETNRFSVLAAGVQLGEGFCITSSGSFIYAVGGEGTERTAKEFDFETETWAPISRMGVGRKFGAAVWYDQVVYALGGRTDNYYNQMEFYSPNTDIWSRPETNIRCNHYKCKAFAIGSEVFLIGRAETRQSYGSCDTNGRCSCCNVVSTENPAPSMAKLDLINSKITPLTTLQTDSELACAVYFD